MKIVTRSALLPHRTRLLATAGLVTALALGGCASNGAAPGTADSKFAAPQVHAGAQEDPIAGAAYWGGVYERDPKNAEAAVNYSRNLRQLGSLAQALMVMQQAHRTHPENAAVLAELGKTLTASGKPDQALAMLAQAETLNSQDWSIYSASGVALDQMGRSEEARAKYARALELSPGQSSVLVNLGLSYALSGDLDQAEITLREAVSKPDAGVYARQNLAIILGLKGDFDEARRLAQADLPPQLAENNMAYLRSMLEQPALWKQMESLDGSAQPAGAAVP